MKKKSLDIIFLLDRSGSMSGTESDTIGGFNSFIKEHKNDEGAKVTTVLFDNQYEVLYERKPITEVKELTPKEYYVRGCTALMDAIGKTINSLSRKIKNKVLFVITTDGLENASREYNKEKIKKLIEKHPNWEFIYIGADIDSYAEAAAIGIRSSNTANYSKSKKGIDTLFRSIGAAYDCMCEEKSLSTNWKQDLDNYIENNQE